MEVADSSKTEQVNMDASQTDKRWKVGAEFESFQEFFKAFCEYCNKSKTYFKRADSRRIASKECGEPVAESLIYSRLKYRCDYFDEDRNIRRTEDLKRPAEIYVATNKDGDRLKILRLNEEHTHACHLTSPGGKIKRTNHPAHPYGNSSVAAIRKKRRKVGRPPKSVTSKSTALTSTSQLSRTGKPNSLVTSSTASKIAEQYFPPPNQYNISESSSSQFRNIQQYGSHPYDTVLATTSMCPGTLNSLTKTADDLFFLSISSEVKKLSRSAKHEVKMKIMDVINNSLLMYRK